MEASSFDELNLSEMTWFNEPKTWRLNGDILEVTTDNKTDFWQGTWYNFHFNTGHVYGVRVKDDFTLTVSKVQFISVVRHDSSRDFYPRKKYKLTYLPNHNF